MSNKSLTIGLSIVILIIVAIAGYNIGYIGSISQINETKIESINELWEEVKDETSESEWKESFMEGCMEEDGSYAFCNCVSLELLDEYSIPELIEIGIDMITNDEIPTWAWEMMSRCSEYW